MVLLRLLQLRSWLKGLPSARLPLVAASTQQASDAAVERLQLLLPGLLPIGSATLGAERRLLHCSHTWTCTYSPPTKPHIDKWRVCTQP